MKKLLFLLGLFLALPIEISAAVPIGRQSSVYNKMLLVIYVAGVVTIIGLAALAVWKNRPRK